MSDNIYNCKELRHDLAEVKALAEEFLMVHEMAIAQRDTQSALVALDRLGKKLHELKIKILPKWARQERVAREILGSSEVMGPTEIEHAFGIALESNEVPSIPYSIEELHRAKELKQFLILRINTLKDDEWLTIKRMYQLINKTDDNATESLEWFSKLSFYNGQNKSTGGFDINAVPRFGWTLVTKDLIPNTTNKTEPEQLEEFVSYVEDVVFPIKDGINMPLEFREAIDEYKKAKESGAFLLNAEYLKIYHLAKPRSAEVFYDNYVYSSHHEWRPRWEEGYARTLGTDRMGAGVIIGHTSGGRVISRLNMLEATQTVGLAFTDVASRLKQR